MAFILILKLLPQYQITMPIHNIRLSEYERKDKLKHNNHEKHQHKHAHIREQVFLLETISGEKCPTIVVLLNYFINMLKKLYMD